MKALKLSLAAPGAALIALLVGLGGTAPAQTAALPNQNCGLAFKDPAGDNNAVATDADANDVNLDILEGWFANDPAKGVTANLRIADMSERVASGGTGVVWNFGYNVDKETTKFVRMLVDFSGTYYEHGTVLPVSDTNPVARYQYEGATEGFFVAGPNGGISMAVPKEIATAGKPLTEPFSSTSSSRQAVPGAVPAPTRGLSNPVDTGPNDAGPGESTGKDWLVGPCAAGGMPPAPTEPGPGPGTTPTPPGGGTTPPPATANPGAQSLPVTLASSKPVKGVKKKGAMPVKLKASEEVTKLAAQLRKGKKVVGKGTLAKLKGTGTLKLKASAKLSKGSYLLDLSAFDGKGQRRTTTLKLKVK